MLPRLVMVFVCTNALALWQPVGWAQVQSPSSPHMSASHALIGGRALCWTYCHPKHQGPVEEWCLKCHAEPAHTRIEATTPRCESCHNEHQAQHGHAKLIPVANGVCLHCHNGLKRQVPTGTPVRFATTVTDFATDHPEFAISATSSAAAKRMRLDSPGARRADGTTLKFNHAKHLEPDPKRSGEQATPGQKPQPLTCRSCHVPTADGGYMQPVSYEDHCASCHTLEFSPRFPGKVVPHETPTVIHAFLVTTFHEGRISWLQAPQSAARLPAQAPASRARTVRQAESEKLLYAKGGKCEKCHAIDHSMRPPTVQPSGVPAVWFPHAQFSHKAHRLLTCLNCHQTVRKSQTSADVLLPGIQVCQQCHKSHTGRNGDNAKNLGDDGIRIGSATTRCVSCHGYHAEPNTRDWNGPLTTQDLLQRLQKSPERPKTLGQP